MQILGSRIKYNKNISLSHLWSLYNPELGLSHLLYYVLMVTFEINSSVLWPENGGGVVECNLNISDLWDGYYFFNFWKSTGFSGYVILAFE